MAGYCGDIESTGFMKAAQLCIMTSIQACLSFYQSGQGSISVVWLCLCMQEQGLGVLHESHHINHLCIRVSYPCHDQLMGHQGCRVLEAFHESIFLTWLMFSLYANGSVNTSKQQLMPHRLQTRRHGCNTELKIGIGQATLQHSTKI